LRAQEAAVPSTGTLTSDFLEFRSTESVIIARGHAVLISSSARLQADEIRFNTRQRTAVATGHVYFEEGPIKGFAERLEYDSNRSTGVFMNGYIEDPPWRVWGRRIQRLGPERFSIERAALTSCDLDPPHYHFRARRGHYKLRKSVAIYSPRFAVQDDPILALPFYRRSLKDRRWTLRLEPGHSAREGLIVRSILTYPLTLNTYGRIYWDHFQNTGNGWGAEYNYFRSDVKGSVYGYRVYDRLDKIERWRGRVGHWQELSPRWSLRANGLFQSDTDVGNRFLRNDFSSVQRQIASDAGVTYSNPRYTFNTSAEHVRAFNPLRNKFVGSKTVAPHLSLQSSPLLLGKSQVYFTGSGSLRNEYTRPSDPILPGKDLFRRTGDAALNLSREFRLSRRITLQPSAGMSETWQSWQDTPEGHDVKDLFQGQGFTRLNWRHRVLRNLDYNLSHSYGVRWTPNTFRRDHAPSDHGVESNALSLFMSYRAGVSLWARASSGYDLRKLEGEVIQSVRQKITPPSLEMNLRPARRLSFLYRQTFLLYPVRRPQTNQFSFQMGNSGGNYLSSGFSYNVGTPGQIQVWHGAAFPLTRGWHLDGGIQYNARGPGGLRYDSVQIIEKKLTVRRDLHCWTARGELLQRPGVNEVYFRIDLKADVEARKRLTSPEEKQFYPGRPAE
jgi:hypothetical protein